MSGIRQRRGENHGVPVSLGLTLIGSRKARVRLLFLSGHGSYVDAGLAVRFLNLLDTSPCHERHSTFPLSCTPKEPGPSESSQYRCKKCLMCQDRPWQYLMGLVGELTWSASTGYRIL